MTGGPLRSFESRCGVSISPSTISLLTECSERNVIRKSARLVNEHVEVLAERPEDFQRDRLIRLDAAFVADEDARPVIGAGGCAHKNLFEDGDATQALIAARRLTPAGGTGA